MTINERLAEVRNALGSDASKVDHILREIEEEGSVIERELIKSRKEISEVNRESAERRIKLREFEEVKSDLESKIEKLSNNEELKTYKSEVERLKEFEQTVFGERKQKLTTELTELSQHPDFEKFVKVNPLPIGEDKKLREEELTNELVEQTRSKLAELRTLGLFGTEKKTEKSAGQKFGPSSNAGDYYGFNSPDELRRKRPDLYTEWRKERGYR